MRYKRILVTGGAGFIGSFLVDKLVALGYAVKIFDNLEEQVHKGKIPAYLNKKSEFIKGDVKDYNAFTNALKDVDAVFHLAARVGVAQSNYEIKDYTDVNIGGIGNLFGIVLNKKLPLKKIILVASMTSYGEGNYSCDSCGTVKPALRDISQLKRKDWELHCPNCQKYVKPIPTDENTPLNNNSIYALTKSLQEAMLMLFGKMYRIPVVSLRGFNVYGPRQSLSNPYTGVTAIFLSRLKNSRNPIVYEDGLQTRDFISVHDVVDALILAMVNDSANYSIINIGSGVSTSVREVVETMASLLKKNIKPYITGEFRKNDIRHCIADITSAKKILGWQPKISLKEGLKELILWSKGELAKDLFNRAEKELREKKLL